MSDVFRFVGELFGVKIEEQTSPVETEPVDPEAKRKALAELAKDGLISDTQETPAPNLHHKGSFAVDQLGNIDYTLLFSQAGVPPSDFTADQAIKVVKSIEKTVPSNMTDPHQRDAFIRDVVLAAVSEPVSKQQIIMDAKKRSEVLGSLLRSRLDIAAELKQKAADRIKNLEHQIAATKAALENTDMQFSAVSASCKAKQADYARIIELLSEPDSVNPPKSQ